MKIQLHHFGFEKRRMSSLVVVGCTYYDLAQDQEKLRAAKQSCLALAHAKTPTVIVDGSKKHARIKEILGNEFVHVFQQVSKGAKGAALQEGLERVRDQYVSHQFVAFMELEKNDLVKDLPALVQHMVPHANSLCLPTRNASLFHTHYPHAQFHSEMFGNMMINSHLRHVAPTLEIDWFFGPVVLSRGLLEYWCEYSKGDSWDVQLVPITTILQTRPDVVILTPEVGFVHDEAIARKENEAGDFGKRFRQLTLLVGMMGECFGV